MKINNTLWNTKYVIWNFFNKQKTASIGMCKICKKEAEKNHTECSLAIINKHDLCEDHEKQRRYFIIFWIIILTLILLIMPFMFYCNSIYEDSEHANWNMDKIRKIAYINELQRQSQMPMNCANPIYGVSGSDQILINMENKPQYEMTIKNGEWVFDGEDRLSGNLIQVNQDCKQRYNNQYDEKIEINLEDTGELIYESKLIKPGYGIELASLNYPLQLDPGTYKASVKFTSYSKYQPIGTSNLEVDFIVKEP